MTTTEQQKARRRAGELTALINDPQGSEADRQAAQRLAEREGFTVTDGKVRVPDAPRADAPPPTASAQAEHVETAGETPAPAERTRDEWIAYLRDNPDTLSQSRLMEIAYERGIERAEYADDVPRDQLPAAVTAILMRAWSGAHGTGKFDGERFDYFKTPGPLTPEKVQRHIRGKQPFTVFLNDPAGTTTKLAVIDFDNKEKYEKRLTEEQLNAKVAEVAQRCTSVGLHGCLCVSRSGSGRNLWFGWSDWQDCAAVDALLVQQIEACGLSIGNDGGVGNGCVELFVKCKNMGVAIPHFNDHACGDYRDSDPVATTNTKTKTKPRKPAKKSTQGGRNSAMFRAVMDMRRDGLADLALEQAARAYNDANCQPPLDDKELAKILKSAEKYSALDKGVQKRIATLGCSDAVKQMLITGEDADLFKVACSFARAGTSPKQLLDLLAVLDPANRLRQCVETEFDDTVVTVTAAYDNVMPWYVRDLNQSHCTAIVGGRHTVVRNGARGLEFMPPSSFADSCAEMVVVGRGAEGNPIRKPRNAAWLDDPQRAAYTGVVLDPGQGPVTATGELNLWRGFAVQSVEGDVSYIKDFMRLLCNGVERDFKYLWNFCAWCIQNPGEASQAVPVLVGPKGCGKSFFVDMIGELLNAGHYLKLDTAEAAVGRFSGHYGNAVLVCWEEATWGGDKKKEGRMKNMITGKTIALEFKGKDIVQVKNILKIFVCANDRRPVAITELERRYFYLDIPVHKHVQDRKYFKALADRLDDSGREALLHALRNENLEDFDVADVPKTEALKREMVEGSDPVMQFWFDACTKAQFGTDDQYDWKHPDKRFAKLLVPRGYLYDLFMMQHPNARWEVSQSEFTRQTVDLIGARKSETQRNYVPPSKRPRILKGMGVDGDEGYAVIEDRDRCLVIPPIEQARAALSLKVFGEPDRVQAEEVDPD